MIGSEKGKWRAFYMNQMETIPSFMYRIFCVRGLSFVASKMIHKRIGPHSERSFYTENTVTPNTSCVRWATMAKHKSLATMTVFIEWRNRMHASFYPIYFSFLPIEILGHIYIRPIICFFVLSQISTLFVSSEDILQFSNC